MTSERKRVFKKRFFT
jgi:hypothetical protein